MTNRPLSVTILAWLYIVTGLVGVGLHAPEFKALHPFPWDTLLVELVSAAAVVAGVYMLRGRNWARWLALAWIAFHVIVSAFHSWREVAIHALLCAVIAYFLLRRPARVYFGAVRTEPRV